MTLIKSISGIRGIIGGKPGDCLTPVDIVSFTAAFGTFIRQRSGNERLKVIIGRDARVSGGMVSHLVTGTLLGLGMDVIDTGLTTTPTVEMAVILSWADAGIIITASHNPMEWNALKLVNEAGEFISDADGKAVLALAKKADFTFAGPDRLGTYTLEDKFINEHIGKILSLELVDLLAIRKARFRVVVDGINSTGGTVIPELLKRLGVEDVLVLNGTPDGRFSHNPEPLKENLGEIMHVVKETGADLGIVVDPDVDRLAFITEEGRMFGEEYTLVSVADFVLKHHPGNTVSNLSSTQALSDVTKTYGCGYYASAVGEVNVVAMMKKVNAVVGGEGNGGVIYPPLHYGRDALVGVALFLSSLARSGKKCSELRKKYPDYYISKQKITLPEKTKIRRILTEVGKRYRSEEIDRSDGIRITFGKEWVHLRKSNTEPIIRIYSESSSQGRADQLARRIMNDIREISGIGV